MYQISTYRTEGYLDHAVLREYLTTSCQNTFSVQEEISAKKQNRAADILFCSVDGITGEEKSFLFTYMKDHPKMKTVIISEEKTFMEDAFRLHVYDYLFSPVLMEDIGKVLDDFLYEKRYTSGIVLRQKGRLLRLEAGEIEYVECMKKTAKIKIHANEEHVIAMRIKELYELLKDQGFYMPHRSYIINIKYIREVYYNHIIMCSHERIPLSQLKIKELRERMGRSVIG